MKKVLLLLAVAFIGTTVKAQTNDSIPSITENDLSDQEYRGFDYLGTAATDTIVRHKATISPILRFGAVNVRSDQQIANSDFAYMRSSGFEIGLMQRQPLSKQSNLIALKYGVTFVYNSLVPTDNRVFALEGNQTNLQVSDKNLRKAHTYFRNSYVNIPLTLDFDFSKKTYNQANRKFVTKEGINFGIGGYVGYNINSKQFISYKDEFGNKVTEKHHGKWNVEDFNYGLTAYVGSRNLKVFAKYDLAPIFKNNTTDQYYWNLGIQLDFGN